MEIYKDNSEEAARTRGPIYRAYRAFRVILWWCLKWLRDTGLLLQRWTVKSVDATVRGVARAYRKTVLFFRQPSTDPVLQVAHALRLLRDNAAYLSTTDDKAYAEFVEQWHASTSAVKKQIYVSDDNNKDSQDLFEYGWGAHSIQFAMDCIPELHKVMLKYYRRKDELKLVDIGAGSGAGTNVFAMLHTSNQVFSRLEVEAVDQVPTRKRWINFMYPRIKYTVGSLEKLGSRKWDFVYCSHVIEHTPDPRAFVGHLMRICKGFVFVYAPYDEQDRIPGHISTITEKVFEELPLESLTIRPSMAWQPQAGGKCILAVIDCRKKQDA
jgi:2-polyprenyl-3-methyl-5-hydroxy-6-metoxy-1,4-benzoquinol methylase